MVKLKTMLLIAGILFIILAIILFTIALVVSNKTTIPENNTSSPNNSFATLVANCLTDKGIRMYGNGTDPEVIKQLSYFGEASKFLTFIDCELNNQTRVACEKFDLKNKGYPLWEYRATYQYRNGPALSLDNLYKIGSCEGLKESDA